MPYVRWPLPLIPAYAVTAHSCQSLTLINVVVHVSKEFTTGLFYTALSRVKTIKGLFIQLTTDFRGKLFEMKDELMSNEHNVHINLIEQFYDKWRRKFGTKST